MSRERRLNHRDPEGSIKHRRHNSDWDSDDFFGLDVESMSPRAQTVTGLVVGGGILAGAAAIVLFTHLWWLIFVFGWIIFPALRLFARGVAGLAEPHSGPLPKNNKERELLQALKTHGELTPAQAAMETSLSVSEADKMLKELAEGGHLEVRVRGGGLFYSLWEPEGEGTPQEIGDQK